MCRFLFFSFFLFQQYLILSTIWKILRSLASYVHYIRDVSYWILFYSFKVLFWFFDLKWVILRKYLLQDHWLNQLLTLSKMQGKLTCSSYSCSLFLKNIIYWLHFSDYNVKLFPNFENSKCCFLVSIHLQFVNFIVDDDVCFDFLKRILIISNWHHYGSYRAKVIALCIKRFLL